MTFQKLNKRIKIAVVGDLLLTAKPDSNEPQRGLETLSDEILDIFADADIVLANLECTLPSEDNVKTEPRVFSSVEQIKSIKGSGINLVTLGNNHCFDGKDEGFKQLTERLNDLAIPYFGAGLNYHEASKAATFEINGVTVAFIAAVDPSSGMNQFANKESSGVAKLDQAELCQQITELEKQYDHVIVTPHWGDERFRIPSMKQIEQSHAFIDAGAVMVAGHHPHVLQGLEQYRNASIVYSLGNFFANPVYWQNGDALNWNRFERTGCILVAEFDKHSLLSTQQIPIFNNGATLIVEKSGWGDRCLTNVNHRLAHGVTPRNYQREAFLVRTIKPILSQLQWTKIRRIRSGHFRKLIKLFSQGINGAN